MARVREFVRNLHPYLLSSIAGALTVAQVILTFAIHRPGIGAVRILGITVWGVGALFAWIPIFTLRRRGGVAKGKSYVHTTELVDSGLYAVVRHPQMGTAWLLMSLALVLIAQHWWSAALAVPTMVLVYLDLLKADDRLISKFGEAYRQYMTRVPRVNFVAGLARLLRQRLSPPGGA
jgi:protein-S-isoprenylcysteine O-methyltransferase Ste14